MIKTYEELVLSINFYEERLEKAQNDLSMYVVNAYHEQESVNDSKGKLDKLKLNLEKFKEK